MPYQKFRNNKISTENGSFDSKREYRRFLELKQMQDEGIIENLQRQVPFELIPKCNLKKSYKIGKKMKNSESAVKYFADFTYTKNGELIVEDVKCTATRNKQEYVIKRKLMLWVHNIQIQEIF